jgi:hypothetical protein
LVCNLSHYFVTNVFLGELKWSERAIAYWHAHTK